MNLSHSQTSSSQNHGICPLTHLPQTSMYSNIYSFDSLISMVSSAYMCKVLEPSNITWPISHPPKNSDVLTSNSHQEIVKGNVLKYGPFSQHYSQ